MSVAYRDHFEFYTKGPYAPFVRETRSSGTEPIRIIHAVQPEGDFSDPAHTDVMLTFALSAGAPITRDFGGGKLRLSHRRGDLELQAPSFATTVLAEGDHEVLAFILPIAGVRAVLEDAQPHFDGDFGHLHAAPFRDFFLEQLCNRLWAESEAGNPHGDIFADSALAMIAATLLGLAHRSAPFSGRRIDHAASTVADYVEAHLDQSIGLRDLAALADAPETQFLSDFKATFGATPHQYVLSRRIARAQELLAAGAMPLAEIAYACGFASQSHMTDVFREKLGVTPGRYRKEVRE